MKPQACIFDIDGTLTDTLGYWTDLGPDWLRAHGYTPAPDDNFYDLILRRTMWEAIEDTRKRYHITEDGEEIAADLWDAARAIYENRAPLKNGCADFLHRLHDDGIPLTVVTNNHEDLVSALLTRCHVRDCFTALFCGGSLHLSKEDTEIYRLAAQALGTDYADTWIFEDSLTPARVAKGLGCHIAGILNPNDPAQENLQGLADAADVTFHNYSEAMHWYEAL